MTSKKIIDKITDDRVRFVPELRHNPADERAAARVPLQVNRPMNVSRAVYLRPTVRTARLFVPDLDEPKSFLQLRIVHDFVP